MSGVQGYVFSLGLGRWHVQCFESGHSGAKQACEPLMHVLQVLTSTYEQGLFRFWDKDSWCGCPAPMMLSDIKCASTSAGSMCCKRASNTCKHACTHDS